MIAQRPTPTRGKMMESPGLIPKEKKRKAAASTARTPDRTKVPLRERSHRGWSDKATPLELPYPLKPTVMERIMEGKELMMPMIPAPAMPPMPKKRTYFLKTRSMLISPMGTSPGGRIWGTYLPISYTRGTSTKKDRKDPAQMMAAYRELSAKEGKVNLIAVEEVSADEVTSYGVVGIEPGAAPLWPVNAMVEKPARGYAPSNLIIMGRYILQPEIFDILSSQSRGAGNEIQITDAMRTMMKTQKFFAYKYSGRSYDCGSKLGFLTANAAFALDHPELAPRFAADLRRLIAEYETGEGAKANGVERIARPAAHGTRA